MPTAALWESCKLRSKSTLANGRVRRNRQCCATSFVAPAYGAKEVSTSLSARKDRGCYKYLLQEFGTELPKVRRSAIDALDDPDLDLVQGAVLALGRWGGVRRRNGAVGALRSRLAHLGRTEYDNLASISSDAGFQN